METVISSVVALCMFIAGELQEHRIQESMSDCLMGSLPADSEQFMLIEDLYKQVEKMQQTQEMNMTNKVNIEFLMKQLDKAQKDIEKLKDKQREFANGNGNY